MSLPFSKFVPISAKVQSPAFAIEKKHMLLAMTSPLIGTDTPYIEFSGASALNNFRAMFGTNLPEYPIVQRYFSFISKTGNAPEKLIVARWYKTAVAPFIMGNSPTMTVAQLKAINNGTFTLTLDGVTHEIMSNLASANSYSEMAAIIQTAIQSNTDDAAFATATVAFNTITGGFIITSGTAGAEATAAAITAGTTGTDIADGLGLIGATISQGVNAETFAEFCDRIFNVNTSGYSITTAETLSVDEIQAAVAWLQGSVGGQTINSAVRLVFNITDKATAKTLQSTLKELLYTGYVVDYDPKNEFVAGLSCAIAATTDYEVANGAVNFNFQPAIGYTPITTVDKVVDYQAGQTNLSLAEELDALCISYVYSVGFGSQQQVLYGMGLMQGAYGTEDVQVNEAALEKDLQTAVISGFVAVNKFALQGTAATGAISTLIDPTFKKYQTNGTIAYDGTLSDTDKIAVFNATANPDAAASIEANGYYYQVQPLTADDIAKRQARVLVCYLSAGVLNVLRITNNIFGA